MTLKTPKTIEAMEKYGHHRPSNVEVMYGISIESVGPSEVGFEECSQRKRLASSFGSPVPPQTKQSYMGGWKMLVGWAPLWLLFLWTYYCMLSYLKPIKITETYSFTKSKSD